MSITKIQIAALIDELSERLLGSTLLSLRAFGKRTFIFQFPKNSLLICLQEPFMRFHLLSQKVKEEETSFCKALFSHLEEARLTAFTQLNNDRILALQFQLRDLCFRVIVELFSKGPNLYLLDKDDRILLTLNPLAETHYHLPDSPLSQPSVEIAKSSLELEDFYRKKESEAELIQAKQLLQERLKQRIQRLKKTKIHCEQELARGQAWKRAQHEAELLQAHFYKLKRGMQEITLEDWENGNACTFKLDPKVEPKDEIAARFKKVKKLRLSIEPLQKQLQAIQQQLIPLEKEWEQALQATSLEEVASLQQSVHLPRIRSVEEKAERRALPYREFTTATGIKIWVGKDAKSNEKLTFGAARGSDWWLHVHNYPGAHVVLRTGKLEPDSEALQDAIQVAIAYSSAKDKGEAEICVTQCKFVSKLGKTGQVQISKHKILRAQFDSNRFKKIKERASQSL